MILFINKTVTILFFVLLMLQILMYVLALEPIKYTSIGVLILFIFFLQIRNIWTWIGIIILCLFGVYDMSVIWRFGYAYFSSMGFLKPIYVLSNRNSGLQGYGTWIVHFFPYFFYVVFLIYLTLPSTRKFYKSEN